MKRFTLAALFLCAALLLSAAAPAFGVPGNRFLGSWRGTDVDGSNLNLWISTDYWSGGRLLHVRGSDDDTGGWCGGRARMEAIGLPEGDDALTTSGAWWCLDPQQTILFPLPGTFTYDGGTDTLSDGSVVYYRGF